MAVTKAKRRHAMEQARASTRIEGHVPTPEFLSDCEKLVAGALTRDELRTRSLARARANEAEAKLIPVSAA